MITLLIVGGVGAAILALSIIFGDLFDLDFGGDAFSTASFGGFIGALGFGGAFVFSLTEIMWLAVVFGVIFGVLMGAGVVWLTRTLKDSPSAAISASSLVGREATVISAIPKAGFGEVHLRLQGQVLKLNARAETALPEGATVWVSAVLSPTAVMVEASDDNYQLPRSS